MLTGSRKPASKFIWQAQFFWSNYLWPFGCAKEKFIPFCQGSSLGGHLQADFRLFYHRPSPPFPYRLPGSSTALKSFDRAQRLRIPIQPGEKGKMRVPWEQEGVKWAKIQSSGPPMRLGTEFTLSITYHKEKCHFWAICKTNGAIAYPFQLYQVSQLVCWVY